MKNPAPEREKIVALVGSPNSGKTTLFNWLTGSKFKTVNYPGATVDYSVGRTHERYGQGVAVMDTPGTYSLEPKSPDERVTLDALYSHPLFGVADLVVSVVDATQLSRHLLVTKQLIESGFRVVVAITMEDLMRERSEDIDCKKLALELGCQVVLINGRLGGGVQDLIDAVRAELAQSKASEKPHIESAKFVWSPEKIEFLMRDVADLARAAVKRTLHGGSTASQRSRAIDRWLMHPVWGLVFFFIVMALLFTSIFWLAAPAMDLVDKSFSALAERVLAINPSSLVMQFFANGLIASASAVLVFVPQIFILFVGIILLEDSGYLARSATLIDKPLSMIGLGGRSFVPILSGYACAVPAMMAARTINSRKERWLTLFILPLMSCSARLPVYALLLSFLFVHQPAWYAGLALAVLYLGSLLLGALAAALANKLMKFKDRSFFMLELPVYRRPQLRLVLRQAMLRTKNYLRRAGPAIFTFALIIWLATTFPNYQFENKTERLDSSYAAEIGRVIEPVFTPMGGDWRTGVGLISAFAAREVFVSSLAIVFQVTDAAEDSLQATLLEKMNQAKAPNGLPLFTVASVLGLIVFFMIALQCLSTVTVAARESGKWKFAIMQLILFNVIAYVLTVGIVQGLRAIGIV